MELVDYPQALAVASREFLVLDQQVKQLKKEIEQIQWDTFSLVSFDPTLKNQNQRDCRKREVLNSNSEYLDLLSKFEKVCQEKSSLEVDIRFLRERCSVMKIAQLARLEFLSRVETPNDIRVHLVGLALQGFFTSSAHNYINPPEATNKIFSFVELLLKQIHDNPANINLWANGISAPEFYNEETEGSEFDGLEDFEQE